MGNSSISQSPPQSFNCPNCGGALEKRLSASKMIVCQYCSGTIVLDDDALRLAGEAAVLVDVPSVLALYGAYRVNDLSFTPIGKLQCSYNNGRGLWEEWWCEMGDGSMAWLSVDEGEIALQGAEPLMEQLSWDTLSVTDVIRIDGKKYRITELDTATIEAYTGELAEVVEVGETYEYAHAEAKNGALITLERESATVARAYRGRWLDPYLVQPN